MRVNVQGPAVLVSERFTRTRGDVEISPWALCSAFQYDGDLIVSSKSPCSGTIADVSRNQTQINLHSSQVRRLVRVFQGEAVTLGGACDASAAIAKLKLRTLGLFAIKCLSPTTPLNANKSLIAIRSLYVYVHERT
jgi:hypothetical protein